MSDEVDFDLGSLPENWAISDIQNETEFVTDYVANGSFAALAENVQYKSIPDYAVLIRLTDFNNQFNGEFVYVDKHAYDFLKKSKLYGGEIIISNVGAYAGTVFLAPKLNRPMTLGPNSIMMNFKNGNKFYYYFFASRVGKFLLDGIIAGSAQPKFNKTEFRKMKIPVPPIEEQKSIASVLSSLDDKIDLLHRQNQTLEAMAETLFRQWFVESGGEEVNTITLGEVAKFSNGKSRPDDTVGGNNPIYGGNGVLGYSVQSNSEGTSIIIGRVGAYCGSVFIERRPIWVSDNAMLVKPVDKNIHSYLFYLLKNLKLNEFAEGSSHPLLTQTLLNSIQVIEPKKERLTLFCEQVDRFLEKVDFNKLQITLLENLRDSLLPKLMSGEVRVA